MWSGLKDESHFTKITNSPDLVSIHGMLNFNRTFLNKTVGNRDWPNRRFDNFTGVIVRVKVVCEVKLWHHCLKSVKITSRNQDYFLKSSCEKTAFKEIFQSGRMPFRNWERIIIKFWAFSLQHTFQIPGSFSRKWIRDLRKAAEEKITSEHNEREQRRTKWWPYNAHRCRGAAN